MEKHKKQRALESDEVENQLGQYTAKNQIAESELQYPLPGCVCIKLFLHRTCKILGSGTTEYRAGGTLTMYWQILTHVCYKLI